MEEEPLWLLYCQAPAHWLRPCPNLFLHSQEFLQCGVPKAASLMEELRFYALYEEWLHRKISSQQQGFYLYMSTAPDGVHFFLSALDMAATASALQVWSFLVGKLVRFAWLLAYTAHMQRHIHVLYVYNTVYIHISPYHLSLSLCLSLSLSFYISTHMYFRPSFFYKCKHTYIHT